jgi:four helix bundle protein
MTNKKKSKELEKRTLEFAVRIINLASELPNTPAGKIVHDQIVDAGTSVGANYREANRAVSKADFKHKIGICEKEASETQYWLEVIVKSKMLPWTRVKPEYEECSELLAIFTSSGRTAKRNP